MLKVIIFLIALAVLAAPAAAFLHGGRGAMAPVWILATGNWNDGGVWQDSAVWID